MTPTLVFDIETIPDVAGIRRINALPAALGEADVLDWALQQRRAAAGNDFLPLHLHRVVAIACALREGQNFRVWSLGESADAGGGHLGRRLAEPAKSCDPRLSRCVYQRAGSRRQLRRPASPSGPLRTADALHGNALRGRPSG